MALKSPRTRTAALAGAAAVAVLGASAAGAQAAKLTETYSCTYPLIGAQPLSVAIDAALPTTAKVNTATGTFAVKATATAGGSTYTGLSLIGAKTIEGTANATASIAAPEGTRSVTVPTTIAKYTSTGSSGDLVLTASGSTPSQTFTKAGTATVKVTALKLNLTAKDSAGKAIVLGTATDSDKNASTFDVTCALSPTTQNTTLGTIAVS